MLHATVPCPRKSIDNHCSDRERTCHTPLIPWLHQCGSVHSRDASEFPCDCASSVCHMQRGLGMHSPFPSLPHIQCSHRPFLLTLDGAFSLSCYTWQEQGASLQTAYVSAFVTGIVDLLCIAIAIPHLQNPMCVPGWQCMKPGNIWSPASHLARAGLCPAIVSCIIDEQEKKLRAIRGGRTIIGDGECPGHALFMAWLDQQGSGRSRQRDCSAGQPLGHLVLHGGA